MDFGSILNASFWGLSFSEARALWEPLIIFVIGVAIYSIFIFKFYRSLARKNIFRLKVKERDRHPGVKKAMYILEYVILFPVAVFFWFLVLSFLLMIIVESKAIGEILFISVALVSAVRIAAYYNEDLSKDLAKMLPFALLALFLIDASYLSFSSPMSLLDQLPGVWKTLVYYLLFVISLEVVLRIITGIKHATVGKSEKKPEVEAVPPQKYQQA